MLTDTALRNLKPKPKTYKAFDRDGMYVTVSPVGTVTFRYDYRLNGRRETLTIGRYGPAGISLALAREKLIDAKKAVAQGKSPALEKQREKRRLTAAKTFGDMTEKWLAGARMADSTKAMRKSIIDRDILPAFQNRQLNEIAADDLRALCNKVKARGAPATAVHIRDIVKQVYAFAILHGEKVDNPADDVGAASIATFVPKDRALSPLEIRLMSRQMESVATYPTIRLALRMIVLTLVRKSELIEATWDEVDFESATWTIPKQRMKGRNPHVVYPRDRMLALQRQAQAASAAAPVDTGLALENLRFRYAISGSNPSWKPLRAFDDGQKVYIQFPAGIAQGELPPLFVIGPEGDGQLVNYRFRSPYYIVDRLFGAAELRLGGDKGDVVRIERTDGVARRN